MMKFYGECKTFNIETLQIELNAVATLSKIEDYSSFQNTFNSALVRKRVLKEENCKIKPTSHI